MLKIYFPVAIIFYFIIFALRAFDMRDAAKYFIPAFVLLTAVFCYLNARDRSYKKGSFLLILALAIAFLADSVINFQKFIPIPGVAIFCATHICLVWYFFMRKPFEIKELYYLIPLLGISIIFCIAIVPQIESKLMFYGVPFYMLLITIMVWRAICLINDKDNLKFILGSVFFYITDISVIMMMPFGEIQALRIETWIVYPPALFLLSLIDNKA